MAPTKPGGLEASKDHYVELVGRYAHSHNQSSDFVAKLAGALPYISAQKAEGYANQIKTRLSEVKTQKGTIEEIVNDLTAAEPTLLSFFKSAGDYELNHGFYGEGFKALRTAAEAVYGHIAKNTPFTDTEEFKTVKTGIEDLLREYKISVSQWENVVKSFTSSQSGMKGALEIVMAEGEQILNGIGKGNKVTRDMEIPIKAMLYLLDEASNPEERTAIIQNINSYHNKLGDALNSRLQIKTSGTSYMASYMGRLTNWLVNKSPNPALSS